MKVECRLSCGHLVGTMAIPDSLIDRPAVAFPLTTPSGWPGQITLTIARWREEGFPERRIFKVKLADLPSLRSLVGFEEDPAFRFYDPADLAMREKLWDIG